MDEVRIGAAAELTGVKSSTLRAWQRRYGVAPTGRSSGRYRLYDQKALAEIQFFLHQLGLGLKPGEARLALRRYRRLRDQPVSEERIEDWSSTLERACLQFDSAEAWRVVKDAAALIGACETLELVLFPAVLRYGNAWHDGAGEIAREHFVSQLCRRAASLSGSATDNPRARVVAGCAPGELHELGLLLLVSELQQRQHRLISLGPAVPVDAFLETLDRSGARVAVISVTLPANLANWSTRLSDIRSRERRGVRFIWAGPAARYARAWPGAVAIDHENALRIISPR